MRKTLLATSAIVAALAFAGAASAQNAHTYPYQVNNAGQNANLSLGNISVGQNLSGSSTAIGNIIDVESVRGQGIGEVNVGTGLGTGPQTNNATQNSSLSATNVTAPSVTVLASTAAGNVTNIDANLVTQRGNGTFSQINNGPAPTTYSYPGGPSFTYQAPGQTASLNVSGGSYGDLSATSGAIGNSLSGTGGTVLLTPAAASPASQANYIPTAVLGQDQVNNSGQTASLSASYTTFATGDLATQAVGNTVTVNATNVANIGGHQFNNGTQSSNLNLNNVTGTGQTDISGLSIGNSTSATAPTVTMYGGPGIPDYGTLRGDSSLRQVNNAGQTSYVSVNNSNLDRVDGSSAAVGNILSLSGGTVSINGDHSQVNNGFQSASMNFNNVVSPGTSNLTSQSVGNLLPATVTGSLGMGFVQTNNAGSTADMNVSGGSFGTLNASSLSMGNSASIVAPTGFIGGINQTNNAGQFSATNVNFSSFSALTAGAASVGNSFSVTTTPR